MIIKLLGGLVVATGLLAAGIVGQTTAVTDGTACSKSGTCCTKDCCKDCPNCDCNCSCCKDCTNGCECPNMKK